MQQGDTVVVTKGGQLRFLSQSAIIQEQQDGNDAGEIIGHIVDLRDLPEDSIVALQPPEPNVDPVLATLSTVREKYA